MDGTPVRRTNGRVKARKTGTRFLQFARYPRSLVPSRIRIALVLGKFSPHLSTKRDRRIGTWADATTSRSPNPDRQLMARACLQRGAAR
jgi:hypothetical protein